MATETLERKPTQLGAWRQYRATHPREEDSDAINEAREMGHVAKREESRE